MVWSHQRENSTCFVLPQEKMPRVKLSHICQASRGSDRPKSSLELLHSKTDQEVGGISFLLRRLRNSLPFYNVRTANFGLFLRQILYGVRLWCSWLQREFPAIYGGCPSRRSSTSWRIWLLPVFAWVVLQTLN